MLGRDWECSGTPGERSQRSLWGPGTDGGVLCLFGALMTYERDPRGS